ncbi:MULTISPECIES: FKBP-type peptidyl-prolyl cis-trans isomerase [Xanthomonas translucens group]|uniref:Peptidyl-prolyl cis-trans isomerase n=1 Tax=Xanthomonas cerealis pv. cerealis TaxID=152263 RepID=A0A514EDT3_9XANT|nr:peptidylprolyl isomerase [Xanthomonas translucens]QDI04174.1 peptidylprolyl isomerase [Xanthomonas translucens pv. cerealis]UKE46154.1 peptidylprolyl isomerase [Xanthomonas translucens pv. cerealis]UKE68507.1 peptidylprolyl isomerase [Xanthomonas translucens pv. pistacia]
MEIANGLVATIHYTLTDDAGEVIDQSSPDNPLSYLHGAGNIVPGLENALTGKRSGERVQVDVIPDEGYGPRHDQLQQEVPRSSFPDAESLAAGMQFQAQTDQGPLLVTVVDVGPELVTIDGNHPLAGQVLHFAVEVAGVREATEQEKDQGHAGAAL